MKEVKLGIFGAAHVHCRNLAPLLRDTPGVRVAGVFDEIPSRAQTFAEASDSRALGTPEALLEDGETDAFVVLAENFRHLDYIKKIIPTGKPLFVEKPFTMNVEEARQAALLLENYPGVFQTGFKNREHPLFAAVKAALVEGQLGRINDVYIQKTVPGREPGWIGTEHEWMRDPKQAGVGLFGDIGTHAIDLFAYLFGRITSVKAQMWPSPWHEEWGVAELESETGVKGIVRAGWDSVALDRKIVVNGDAGSLLGWSSFFWKDYEKKKDFLAVQSTLKYPGEGFVVQSSFPPKPQDPMLDWVDTIAGKGEPSPLATVDEAVHVRAVLDACYISAGSGNKVAL